MIHRPILALSLLAAPFSAQGQVWVVDTEFGPGVDALEITTAIDLASDGDLILVRPGSYDPFAVNGKSLVIQGDPGAAVMPDFQADEPETAVTIVNLTADQSVTVRGLVVFQFGHVNPMLNVRDSAGAVVFEDIFGDFLGGFSALEATDAESVTISGSHVQTSLLAPESGPPEDAAGIDALRSSVFLHETFFVAASGHAPVPQEDGVIPPSDGAPGARLLDSTLTLSGSTLIGGSGGFSFGFCEPPGHGGDGVVMDTAGGAGSPLRLVDSLPEGGFGGAAGAECGFSPGAMGESFDVVTGTIEFLPGTARELQLSSPVTEGSPLSAQFTGNAGDLVLLLTGIDAIPGQFVAGLGGTLHVDLALVASLGTLGGPTQELLVNAPNLPLGTTFLTLRAQAAYLDGNGDFYLTGPSATTVVSSSL